MVPRQYVEKLPIFAVFTENNISSMSAFCCDASVSLFFRVFHYFLQHFGRHFTNSSANVGFESTRRLWLVDICFGLKISPQKKSGGTKSGERGGLSKLPFLI